MAELLTSTAIRPPVVASAINNGGNLEKRLKMMIADKTWKVPTALRLGMVALASCILPLGRVHAQDFEAVERRLGGAVEAGELTLEQASVMLEALKRPAGSEHAHHREMEVKKRRYMAFANEIEAAVKSGKLSKQDAEKKLIAVRKEMFGQPGEKKSHGEKHTDRELEARKRRYVANAKEIEAAVRAGKLSKEDAAKKLIAMRREISGQPGEKKSHGEKDADRELDARRRRYMANANEIEAAVRAGKLSKEDAAKRLLAVRKELFGQPGEKKSHGEKHTDREFEARKRRYMEFANEIEAAVKSGKLSKEDAEKKLIAIRKEMFGQPGKKKSRGEKGTDRELEARKRRYEQAAKRIRAAIGKGDLSANDGEKELLKIRKEIFGDRD